MLGEYKRIMVPVDGSLPSIDAFKKAVHIAKRNDAELRLVTIADKKDNAEEAAYLQSSKDELFRALDEYAQKENLPIKKDIKTGNAKKMIAEDLVKDWNIDLIVIGATGKGRIAKMVLGSITNHVTRYARCDVLIVK